MPLHERLAQLLRDHGMSGYALEHSLNISNGSSSKWLSGRSLPSAETIIKLAGLFGVSTDYLLTGEIAKTGHYLTETEEQVIANFRARDRSTIGTFTFLTPEALEIGERWELLPPDSQAQVRVAIRDEERALARAEQG